MKRASLKTQAYSILRERITSCVYAPGRQMNEELLQSELGMSRTPIRDALGRLEQEGLVIIRPKKGITVAPLSLRELNMSYELRLLLECYALRTYGEMLSEERLLYFYRLFSGGREMTEADYYKADDDFHQMLIDAVPNVYIARSYEQIMSQTTRLRILSGSRTASRLAETNDEHLLITNACLKKDWGAAVAALEQHLRASKAVAFDLLQKQGEIC